MSEIIWKKAMIPSQDQTPSEFRPEFYGDALLVPNTKAVEFNEREADLPDRRAFRTMSRAAMMLSKIGLESKEAVDPVLAKDPFKVGIYFAVENGPVDTESTYKMKDMTSENFATEYKKNRNPTMYLKQLPNLAAAHLGIYMGVLGPMNVYNDSQNGSLHALDQAEFDLNSGLVDLAIVGSAFSFESPLAVKRNSVSFQGSRTMCEGAGVLILKKSDKKTDWVQTRTNFDQDYYGVADQIIKTALDN